MGKYGRSKKTKSDIAGQRYRSNKFMSGKNEVYGRDRDHWIRAFGGVAPSDFKKVVGDPVKKSAKVLDESVRKTHRFLKRGVDPFSVFAEGGLVGGYANSGMVRQYAGGGPVEGGLGGMEGGGWPEEKLAQIPPDQLQAVVIEAKQALEGNHPDPEGALSLFIDMFGEEELASLKEAVLQEQGGGDMGDGTSDSIPAMVDGTEPAALSSGEFVVPADAVSGLGNGDTEAGGARLSDMIGKIRTAKGMPVQQPPNLNPEEVMPV